ncbi:transglycosylase SLT domain-containing protein [Nocardioides sp.]|uniref:aggregation-promoting factor C-terminal-like domain-containing protein n=1 Tax=Nocardioides sp. TaxID=35761 RepID=UPI0037833AAC
MSKRTKYVPKHRHAPERPLVEAPKKALKNTVLLSSVAVAATGAAVSGGVLSSPAGVSAAAEDLGSQVSAPIQGGSVPEADRAPVVSRSSDRRDATDPAKKAALSVAGGPAVTDRVELSEGDPRDIARALMPQFGFSSDQFGCLDSLWMRESGWNPSAQNASSGAYGIPQSLPGSKMASAGADWATNPATQIEWGLGYIRDRYGSPCGAWGHSESYGWY